MDRDQWSKVGALVRAGQKREALDLLDQLIKLNPGEIRGWTTKGMLLTNLGHHAESLRCFEQAIVLNPCDAAAWYGKGVGLWNLARKQEAVASLQRAQKLGSESAAEALARFEREMAPPAVVSAGKPGGEWVAKAGKSYACGRVTEAAEFLTDAIALNPDNGEAWVLKCGVLTDLGRMEEALACIDRALEIDNGNPGHWFEKGLLLGRLNRFQDAVACFDRTVALDPSRADAWFNKGADLFNARQAFDEESLACFERAEKLGHAEARKLVAACRTMLHSQPER